MHEAKGVNMRFSVAGPGLVFSLFGAHADNANESHHANKNRIFPPSPILELHGFIHAQKVDNWILMAVYVGLGLFAQAGVQEVASMYLMKVPHYV